MTHTPSSSRPPCGVRRPGRTRTSTGPCTLSEQAVAPPGRARSDLDIWVDYARRMGFRNRSGQPLPTWDTARGAFDGWRDCSRGRPCDYSAMTYDKLRGHGIQWPCTDEHPDGTERIYTDHQFHTFDDDCETYGHDLATGAAVTPVEHRAVQYDGRARLKCAEWMPPPENPDGSYPLHLNTGRTVYQFHTRTKTGRAPELARAAPEAWVELAPEDAAEHHIADGDLARVESVRGHVEVPARCAGTKPGSVFLPFHYGNFDPTPSNGNGAAAESESSGHSVSERPRAANELTLTAWDPVSKQPTFKSGAVRITRLDDTPDPARKET